MRQLILAALIVSACGAPGKLAATTRFLAHGESRELRKRDDTSPQSSPNKPGIVIVTLDGVDRALLYTMLEKGELPGFSALLGGSGGKFPHAHLDKTMLSVLPSSTMAAWTSVFTGLPPGQHGVTGNEYFIRENKTLGAPAPVTFVDAKMTLKIYNDGYLDELKGVPSVYDRMRAQDPNLLVWVAVHPIFSGADRLLLTRPTILAKAFEHVLEDVIKKAGGAKENRGAFEKLDAEVAAVVIDELEHGVLPDVLNVYLSGTDLYAHIAEEGPDEARHVYLKEVVDPLIAKLHRRLVERDAFDNRYVVITSDHGHTRVQYDDAHALSSDGPDEPPEVMKQAGFRVRPFKWEVSKKDDFNAVLASGGAMAYVYVADRSTCTPSEKEEKPVCDWTKPPRYEGDVLPMAEAFFAANKDGKYVAAMKGTLDMVLTRKPKPYVEVDAPFEVYVGEGKTVPLPQYLTEHPHPTYVDFDARLRDLAVGPKGERAGDVLLLAHNGDREAEADRYYFATLYRSWHGSPSRKDSEVPFIVANPKRGADDLSTEVRGILGNAPYQQKVTDVLLSLRYGKR